MCARAAFVKLRAQASAGRAECSTACVPGGIHLWTQPMTSSLWRLDTVDTTLLLHSAAEQDVPSVVWFGERLADNIDASDISSVTDLPLPMAKLDSAVPLSLFPQRSTGIDCSPALRGHSDGCQFECSFSREAVSVKNNELLVELFDQSAQLRLLISLAIHSPSGVVSVSTELVNESNQSFNIDWLASATMPLPAHYGECMHLHGRWGLEFQSARSAIDTGMLMLQSHRGRTSHERYPGVLLGSAGFSETTGDVMAAKFAWSGCHATLIEKLSDGSCYYQCGVSLDSGELQLAAGESHSTPACHFSRHAKDGLNAVSASMHEFVRSEILPAWTRTERPVHANSWEALYFDHDIDTLKSLVDAAAEVGAERFILDDGWFVARRSDDAGLGDWTVDSKVYPDGLHPLVNHVRDKGLQFGLWFEPEMVNPDSDLYRNHPDWVLHRQSLNTPLARNQLVVNIDLPQAYDYLYQCISALVKEYRIDYIKWDHNRDLILAGDGERSRMLRQTTACYRLMDQLSSEFDWLEIESCSSGGARADWGILKYTGRVWTSDSIDAIDRAKIQRGYSYFNPPEIMGAHVGHAEAHLTGREIGIHTRAIVALQGQYGYEVDARKLDAQEKQLLQHYVSLYKKHRSWIASCRTVRLEPVVENLICSGMVSHDQNSSLWFAVAVASLPSTLPGKLVLKYLSAEKTYRVTLASGNLDELKVFCKKIPVWLANGVEVRGAILMTVGLTLPVMPAQSALLLEATAVD